MRRHDGVCTVETVDPDVPVVPLPLTQRLSTRQWTTVDVVVAALLALASIGAVVADTRQNHGVHGAALNALRIGLIVVACAALPYRRLHPKPVMAVITAASTASILVGARGPMMLAVVMAVYTVASLSPPRVSLRVVVMVITAVTVASLLANGWDAIATPLPILVGWLAGENSRTRRAYIAGVTAWASERDREREERSRRAVADERLRIARELHDVVAHTMSVVAVRSGVARVVVDTQPEEARRALEIIETTSRRALQEMRLLVGVLREGDAGRDYTPAPGMADLPRLVEEIGAAGVTVSVQVEGEPRPLPPGVDVSVFRILQEALTNVVRHAGGARARLLVRYQTDRVELEVSDDGGGRSGTARYPAYPNSSAAVATTPVATAVATKPAESQGHGLVGMRERVALFGGTLAAGATPSGFTVTAVIPTDDRTAPP